MVEVLQDRLGSEEWAEVVGTVGWLHLSRYCGRSASLDAVVSTDVR